MKVPHGNRWCSAFNNHKIYQRGSWIFLSRNVGSIYNLLAMIPLLVTTKQKAQIFQSNCLWEQEITPIVIIYYNKSYNTAQHPAVQFLRKAACLVLFEASVAAHSLEKGQWQGVTDSSQLFNVIVCPLQCIAYCFFLLILQGYLQCWNFTIHQ